MTQRTTSAAKQRGFSLLTGFILAIIMFGSLAFFLAGQGINSGFGSTYSNSSKASSLLTSAGYINTGFDAVVLGGGSPSQVTFDTGTYGIFNPTTGGTSQQTLDPSLFIDTTGYDGYWIYRGSNVRLQGVGTTVAGNGAAGLATNEYTVMAAGLKQSVCQQINYMLHATAITATFPAGQTLAENAAALIGPNSVTVTAPSSLVTPVDLTAEGVSGWTAGCYKTADGLYVYIHTLLAQ